MSPSPSLTVANDQHVSQETKKDSFFSKKDSREQNWSQSYEIILVFNVLRMCYVNIDQIRIKIEETNT